MLDGALEGSAVVRCYESLTERAETLLEASGLSAVAATAGRFVRASYCYRWLTTEPDPDVIVIDLRETYTVGPVIRLLEGAGAVLATGYANSGVEPVASATVEAARARPLRMLGAVGVVAASTSLLTFALLGSLTTALFAAHFVVVALSAVALRSRHSLSELLESRPATVLVAALEPPEPPDARRESATDEPDGLEEAEPAETASDGSETADGRGSDR